MPRVSVVIPVYNSAPELPAALTSIAEQTERDIEIICVDDGSTDGSGAIVAEHAARDPRIVLIQQENAGGGAARNRGYAAATGEYVAFLDADDLFSPALLERTTSRLDATGADFSLHNGVAFTDEPPQLSAELAGSYLRHKLLPDANPFAPHDVPDRALQLATPAAWLRVYRRSFIDTHGLRFLPSGVANDVGFTAEATLAARSIVVIDEVLVLYRREHGTTQTSSYDDDPLLFLPALRDLRARIVALGALPHFEQTYRIQCMNLISHALRTTSSSSGYERLHDAVQRELLDEFSLRDLDPDYFLLRYLKEAYVAVTTTRAAASPLHPRNRRRPPSRLDRLRSTLRRRARTAS